MYPGEFEEFFRTTISDFSPQNQRALRAIIQLLAELLDGTSNDGDRGVLTAAFAEMLVPAGNANDFISLMDRLVQDIEALFAVQTPGLLTPNYGSVDSRGRSTAGGSISSNTSLRKRFGFGTLTRENSKSENESKVGSLWRSLSKNSHGPDSQPSSVSKAGHASLGRSNSTDTGRQSPKRPSSRDRPTVLGAFTFENGSVTGNNRSFVGALGTIGEVPPTAGPPRKKRRSSLSDLKTLQDANDVPTWSSQSPRRPEPRSRDTRQSSAEPQTPLRTTPSAIKHASAIPTPTRLGSPMRKENSPGNVLDRAGSVRPKSMAMKTEMSDEVTIKSHGPVKRRSERGDSVSGIPSLKSTASSAGLSERPGSGNTIKMPPSSRGPTKTGAATAAGPPKKLRMQSPQKLRERLQNQQRDIDSASLDLQNELSAIGHELDARTIPRLTTQSSAPPTSSPSKTGSAESRMATLEKHLKTTLETLSSRTASIGQDVSTSLQVSEARAKHLDQLYRELNAENEALYARFNEELEKVTSSARKGKADEEVQRRLKASEEESARLRKENARLKREVAGLKAQIRE
jgi:hypothetical protein